MVSGTSERLGVRPRCDPTICTAPTHLLGSVSSAWVFPTMGTRNLGTVGHRGGHGVQNTPWGEKCYLGGGGVKEGVCECVIRYWSADVTWEALKAMAGQASLPAPLCGPSSPNAHAAAREGEGEGTLLLAPRQASLFSTQHGSQW